MVNFIFIENYPALLRLCNELRDCPWLAVDTEFERTNTYYPELCLVQVASKKTTAIIDPRIINDLDPLYELLYNPATTKVFHSARQDLELFFHIKGDLPSPIFDTQIAASILDYDEQIGYANLVKEILNVDLSKAMTRTNWKQRPLDSRQLEYAANDVYYLAQIYELISIKLVDPEQLISLADAFDRLTSPALYRPNPEDMWLKVRQARKLSGKILNVFKKLTAWREVTAREENRPRNWILHDTTLVEIARSMPRDKDDLYRIKGVNKRTIKVHGITIAEIIRNTLSLAESESIS